MAQKSLQKSKKTKRPDRRPARARYWRSGRLAERKIRNLLRSGQFESLADARAYWLSVRKRFYGVGYAPRS